MTVLEITNDIYTTLKEKNVCEEISAEVMWERQAVIK